ncbi:hypothetical protein HYS28_03435 [Candidatus Uhrbacteria bacterium]|nr:hypothetical protein [Candidatus Uhrbacteria bacterium]
MPRYIRLTDSEIHAIAGRRGATSRDAALIEAALQILSRYKGSNLTVDHVDEVMRDLARNLIRDSTAGKVVYDVEALYDARNQAEA